MAVIAFFEVEPWERKYLQQHLKKHKLIFFEEPLSKRHFPRIRDIDILAIFIYSKINGSVLKSIPQLRLITTMSTGFDHIDLKACTRRGVTACNVPAYGDSTVAEHTFALILALARKLVPSVERTRRGNFSLEGLRGFDIQGKTLGIIGTGRIGTCAIRIANGFGMKVIAYDAHPKRGLAKELGFRYVKKLDTLLAKSDIVSLHVPLTRDTKHIINRKNISKFKKGAMLINTARGGLVHTEALLEGLKTGRISKTGLDVLEEECFVREEKALLTKTFQKKCDLRTALAQHMLLNHPNALITPHNAFNSDEALRRIMDTTVENIKGFIKKKPVHTLK